MWANRYWPIKPLATCTVWVAIDDVDRGNGDDSLWINAAISKPDPKYSSHHEMWVTCTAGPLYHDDMHATATMTITGCMRVVPRTHKDGSMLPHIVESRARLVLNQASRTQCGLMD